MEYPLSLKTRAKTKPWDEIPYIFEFNGYFLDIQARHVTQIPSPWFGAEQIAYPGPAVAGAVCGPFSVVNCPEEFMKIPVRNHNVSTPR